MREVPCFISRETMQESTERFEAQVKRRSDTDAGGLSR